jgi:RpiB/LacA/LacB family sugar-phosphate isomerase
MKKYNLLVPLAGRGQRFVDEGYVVPKYMITARDRHLIDWALSSIDTQECNLIFCLRQDHINNFGVDDVFRKKFGNDIKIVVIDKITDGSVSTCLLAKDYIDNDLPLFIYTVDVHFQRKFVPVPFQNNSGLVLTFKSNNPAYSYVKTDKNGIATLTAEKEVISNNACVGVYGFATGALFVKYAEKMIAQNLRTRNEFYITPLYNLMIQDKHAVTIQEVERMYIMGTPEEYKFFTTRVLNPFTIKPIALVSDHSGYELKEQAKEVLIAHGLKYIDLGCYTNKDCDQFDYVSQAITFIKNGTCGYALGFCCTGQAVNMAANKTDGIRAALVYDTYSAEYAIKHNCANFFSIPARITTTSDLSQYISLWLATDFEGGRHCARIQKIESSYGRL